MVVPSSVAVENRATTGPEIWADTGGSVTHLVAGIGTGGTISGAGGHLKEISNGRVTVVGTDPVTSTYGGGDGSPFLVEAAGHYLRPDTTLGTWPQSYHPEVLDRIETVPDRESVTTVRRLAHEEGLLVGGSSGLATAAALRVARGLGPEHTVVAILPDSGRAYLSKYHSPIWLRRNGSSTTTAPPLTVGTGETGGEALARLDADGRSHAVLLRDGRLAGIVSRADLVRAAGRPARPSRTPSLSAAP